jgi:hypothetical protein
MLLVQARYARAVLTDHANRVTAEPSRGALTGLSRDPACESAAAARIDRSRAK